MLLFALFCVLAGVDVSSARDCCSDDLPAVPRVEVRVDVRRPVFFGFEMSVMKRAGGLIGSASGRPGEMKWERWLIALVSGLGGISVGGMSAEGLRSPVSAYLSCRRQVALEMIRDMEPMGA